VEYPKVSERNAKGGAFIREDRVPYGELQEVIL